MPLLIQHALEEENPCRSSMTDVHSDSACMPLVMGNSVSLRDLIQWLTTLFTRRFSSLLSWNLSYWDYFPGFGSYPLATQNKFAFFLTKRISKILFQLFRYCDLAFLNLLPLIFHLMDKQLLFPYPFPMGSDLQILKAMAAHSSTLAWKIPWTEEPGRLQSMGSLRVGHNWATSLSLFTFMHWRRKWQPTLVFLPGESQGWQSLVGFRLWGHTESNTTEAT